MPVDPKWVSLNNEKFTEEIVLPVGIIEIPGPLVLSRAVQVRGAIHCRDV